MENEKKVENTNVESETKEEIKIEESEMAFGITEEEFQELQETKEEE